MRPGSPNPDPISDQKMSFFRPHFPYPFSNLAFRQKLCHRYSLLERKQKRSSNIFRIRIFLFLSFSSGIEAKIRPYASVVPSKTIPDFRLKWAKCIPVFRPKRHKNPTVRTPSSLRRAWASQSSQNRITRV